MNSIKLVGCIVALVVLIAFIAPVSAVSYSGVSQAGSKYTGNQVSMSSVMGSTTTASHGSPNLGYSFAVKGSGTNPSLGDVSAYSNYNSRSTGRIISFSERVSASGIINHFSYTISFIP